MEGGVDIADIPIYIRCKPSSLKGLTALFLKKKLDKRKSITMSNWEHVTLSDDQIKYAGK